MDSALTMGGKHYSPLSLAAYFGRREIVKEILKSHVKIDVNQQTIDRKHTPLYEAAAAEINPKEDTRTLDVIESDYVEIIKDLGEAGADPNLAAISGVGGGEDGNTPLIIATYLGHCERAAEIAKISTVDFGQSNSVGDNALHKAVI